MIDPFETKSRQVVAPEVAKLDGLLASSSNVGEEETDAFAGVKIPEIPIVSVNALTIKQRVREFTLEYY